MRRTLLALALLAACPALAAAPAIPPGIPGLMARNALSELVANGMASAARANLGLGTIATQSASAPVLGNVQSSALGIGAPNIGQGIALASAASGGCGGPWTASDLVVGGVSSLQTGGGAAMSLRYDATNSRGIVCVIAPNQAWLPLVFQAQLFSLLSSGGTQGLYQDPSARVGIGTAVPAYPLDVAGIARLQQPALLSKQSAAPTAAPGAGLAEIFAVAGTNAGTCKLQVMAGTSVTPVTIVDNVGAGC